MPPPRVSRSLLLQAIAYRLQEKTLGGLKPSIRRLLQQVATDAAAGRAAALETSAGSALGVTSCLRVKTRPHVPAKSEIS
jgi:hypothetical protein